MIRLSYQSPGVVNQSRVNRPPANRQTAACVGVVAFLTIALNTVLLSSAASDRSWRALYIMLLAGPVANLVLLVFSLALTPLVRRVSGGAAVGPYLLAGTLIPLSAIALDTACILSMDLHGC